MALVSIQQSDLDSVAAAIEAVASAVSTLGSLPPADEAALSKAVTDLQSALATAQGNATPAPAPGP